jgi:transposase
MTLHPHSIGPVPEETARIAHAACPKGNPYLHMRDLLGTLYDDQLFTALFPLHGQPALAPWRLALITILQFARSAYRTGKPPKPCAFVLTGSTR